MGKIDSANSEPAIRTLDDAELDMVSGGLGFWDDGGCTPHWTKGGLYLPQPIKPFGDVFKQSTL